MVLWVNCESRVHTAQPRLQISFENIGAILFWPVIKLAHEPLLHRGKRENESLLDSQRGLLLLLLQNELKSFTFATMN